MSRESNNISIVLALTKSSLYTILDSYFKDCPKDDDKYV